MGARPHVGRGQMRDPHIRELSARRNQAEHTHWDGQQGECPWPALGVNLSIIAHINQQLQQAFSRVFLVQMSPAGHISTT